MARYLVQREKHFKDGVLYMVGETVEYEKPIPNIKDWVGYLVPVEEPPKQAVPPPAK
jgi:hypothetical protein